MIRYMYLMPSFKQKGAHKKKHKSLASMQVGRTKKERKILIPTENSIFYRLGLFSWMLEELSFNSF